jgi:hypothetical protein
MLFAGTTYYWRLLEPIEFVYEAKYGKIYDKIISILGRLGQV